MQSSLAQPLTIGVSTRALFDLHDEHAVFCAEGVEAYAALQRARENEPLKPGTAFEVIKRLLALNDGAQHRLVGCSRPLPKLSGPVASRLPLGRALRP